MQTIGFKVERNKLISKLLKNANFCELEQSKNRQKNGDQTFMYEENSLQ